MFKIHLVFVALATLVFSIPLFAQGSDYTGSISAGLALTSGNTDTTNANLAIGIVRDLKTRNVIKANALYLRGKQNDLLTVDRTSANLRDEYTLSGRTFVFGQMDYFRDKFKDINYLLSPTAGAGYKVLNTDSTLFLLDAGVGGVWEKNVDAAVRAAGSLNTGERFSHKVSSSVALTQSLNTLWKMNDFGDSLSNFAAGLTTTINKRLDIKMEFLDSLKNKPLRIGIKKNDTAFVTSLVVKF